MQEFLIGNIKAPNNLADMVDGAGRNLFEVLGAATIPEAMAEIRRRCNNNGEIGGSGIPDFSGLMVGDYIDGLDLSGIEAAPGGTAPQAWNGAYKNNRVVVSGFNAYKGAGDAENAKNHVLFTFRNALCQGQMNAAGDNAGGYPATEMRAWLEGESGDGGGAVATGLKAALGGDYLYTIRKFCSVRGSPGWGNYTVWPPSEIEVLGKQYHGDEINAGSMAIHFPIFQKGYAYLIKYYNGIRCDYYTSSPSPITNQAFTFMYGDGIAGSTNGYNIICIAPAFCVA
jgi:hypothetical protein